MNQNRQQLLLIALIVFVLFLVAPWIVVNGVIIAAGSYLILGRLFKARRWWIPVAVFAVYAALVYTVGNLLR